MRRSHHFDPRGNTHDRRMRRQWVLTTFGYRGVVACHWCGKRMRSRFEIDRFPVCGHAGGRYTRDNIVPACGRCNRKRCATATCRRFCSKSPSVPF